MPTRSTRRRWCATASLLTLLLTQTGCARTTASSGLIETPPPALLQASFCEVAEPIGWSARDTDQTIKQVKQFNAVGTELCGWGHKKP